MNLDLIRIFASDNGLKCSELLPLNRRKDPLDAQAGAQRQDEEVVELYLDKVEGIVYKIGPIGHLKRFQTDVTASNIALEKGISVAAPVGESEIIEGKVIYATKFIEHNPKETPNPLNTGKALAELHNVKIDNDELPIVTSQLPAFVKYALETDGIPSGIRKAVQERCLPCINMIQEDLQNNFTMVHGDPHLGNILPTENKPTLIDFECSGRGSPLWDLAVVIQSSRRFGLDRRWADECMEGWSTGHSYDAELLNQYVDWRCWYGVLSMLKRVQEGIGYDGELTVRLKWLEDPNDQSRWKRC